MTTPSPETLEREADKLFVTDAELIRRLGVPEKLGRVMLHGLDEAKGNGFPRKDKLLDRRYWPAVKAYFDRQNGLIMGAPPQIFRGTNERG